MIPWIHCRQLCTLVYIFLTSRIVVEAEISQDLTDVQVEIIQWRLKESAKLSWELGTRAQTILEHNNSIYSVFSGRGLPPWNDILDNSTINGLQNFFDIADNVVTSQLFKYPQPLMGDASAADPASLGVCVLIANWTKTTNRRASKGLDYAGAAKSQIDFLFSSVPRTQDGALSHRISELQLWSSYVYMVPPFLAYYGMTTRNLTMVREAYNQIQLYRKYLRDPSQNMWMHVVLGPWEDRGFWSTGNGWAAAGMLRVYTTIQYSEYATALMPELKNLSDWVQEIHKGMYGHLDNTSIFANYAERPANATGNFYDAASTALLASTVYRAAQFLGQGNFVSFAEKSRMALSTRYDTNPPNSGTLFPSSVHFTQNGVLQPVVDPYSGTRTTTISPEAQAFVIQMHHAWKDWKAWKGRTSFSGERSVPVIGIKGSILVVFIIWLTFAFV